MSISPESVVGVLVAYKPNEELHRRIEGHLTQLSHLVVIENSAAQAGVNSLLESFAKQNPAITLMHQAANNLAAAQNMGIAEARNIGATAVLLLDDDSDMEPDMLANLCAAHEDGFGLIAPDMQEQGGAQSNYVVPALYLAFRCMRFAECDKIDGAFNIIASGSLIPMDVLDHIGLMDESFGIDYIDREFCLRLLTRGWKTRVVRDAKLRHNIGQSEAHAMGVVTRNHPAARRYTIFRNRMRCWARYGFSAPSFLFYDMLAAMYDLLRITLFEDDKKAKLKAALCGAWAAIAGEKND